jgi:hypothetical protein
VGWQLADTPRSTTPTPLPTPPPQGGREQTELAARRFTSQSYSRGLFGLLHRRYPILGALPSPGAKRRGEGLGAGALRPQLPRGRAMKLHYYPETDSLYIEFKRATGAETREIVEGLAQARLVEDRDDRTAARNRSGVMLGRDARAVARSTRSVRSPPHATRACLGCELSCASRASPTCGGEGLGVGVTRRERPPLYSAGK